MTQLPKRSGVSLKAEHYQYILDVKPKVGWFEIHAENYMGNGGPPHAYLNQIIQDYPLSIHGVGLSLGSAKGLSDQHLKKLKVLVDRYNPAHISEHLSWSLYDAVFLNDLLPMPYNNDSFNILKNNIDTTQNYLNRRILIENPSSYIEFKNNNDNEPSFLNRLCQSTDCGLLLDINNIFVSGYNQCFNPREYLADINFSYVDEIHLAGHATSHLIDEKKIKIDDHGSPVCDEVWDLFKLAIQLNKGPAATLIEWDTNIPEFDILEKEANKADAILTSHLSQL